MTSRLSDIVTVLLTRVQYVLVRTPTRVSIFLVHVWNKHEPEHWRGKRGPVGGEIFCMHYFRTTCGGRCLESIIIRKRYSRTTQETPFTMMNPAQYPTKKKKIPQFGKPAPCKPTRFPLEKQSGLVSWAWCPSWSWLMLVVLVVMFIAFLGFFFFLSGIIIGSGAMIGLGLLMTIVGCPALCGVFNWIWNAQKQQAYGYARFKSIEAEALWKNVDPQFYYQAKDVFFTTRYGGKTLTVLRDGTIEVHGVHNAVSGGDGSGDGGDDGGANEGTDAVDQTASATL
jgi:hypothetical protein